MSNFRHSVVATVLVSSLVACGGGRSGGGNANPEPTPTTSPEPSPTPSVGAGPALLGVVGQVATSGPAARRLAAADGRAYVVGYDPIAGSDPVEFDGRLTVVNVANPSAPEVVSTFAAAGVIPLDVALSGSYALLANLSGPLVVIDTSDPSAPALVASADAPSCSSISTHSVTVSDSRAYVGAVCRSDDVASAFLQAIDIENPAEPTLIGAVQLPNFPGATPRRVVLSGTTAYVAHGRLLIAVEISDGASPTVIGWADLPQLIADVAVVGSYAYVATVATPAGGLANTIEIVGVADPTQLTVIESVPYGPVGGLEAAESLLYVAGENRRIDPTTSQEVVAQMTVLDISDPLSPRLVAEAESAVSVDIAMAGPLAYVAAVYDGLQAIALGQFAATP